MAATATTKATKATKATSGAAILAVAGRGVSGHYAHRKCLPVDYEANMTGPGRPLLDGKPGPEVKTIPRS
jgi:hypothetical protein